MTVAETNIVCVCVCVCLFAGSAGIMRVEGGMIERDGWTGYDGFLFGLPFATGKTFGVVFVLLHQSSNIACMFTRTDLPSAPHLLYHTSRPLKARLTLAKKRLAATLSTWLPVPAPPVWKRVSHTGPDTGRWLVVRMLHNCKDNGRD